MNAKYSHITPTVRISHSQRRAERSPQASHRSQRVKMLLTLAATALLTLPALAAPGQWSPTGNLTIARKYHTATLLPSGKVLVAGGWDSNSVELATAELYDPATGV